jgi:hypothetical protein
VAHPLKIRKTKMNWNNKDNAKNKQDAMSALADLLSKTETLENRPDDTLTEAEEFAEKWNVPFSKSLYQAMLDKIEDKRWDDDHVYFQSSSAYC